MQAKDALKMTLDDKRRKRQDELNYRTDLIGAIFMMVVGIGLTVLIVACAIAAITELAK
jgi:hypothetical protein